MVSREKIIDEAFRESLSRGYQCADVISIGRRAGVTKGDLYYQFKSKSHLALAVLDHIESKTGCPVDADLSCELPFVFRSLVWKPQSTGVQSWAEIAAVLTGFSNEVRRSCKSVHARIESIVEAVLDKLTLAILQERMNKPNGLTISADELSLLVGSAVLGCVALSQICRHRSFIEQVQLTLDRLAHCELAIEPVH